MRYNVSSIHKYLFISSFYIKKIILFSSLLDTFLGDTGPRFEQEYVAQ
jgi:hypothetical protein